VARPVAEAHGIARRAVEEARKHIPVVDAIVFGSYADGIPHEWSDIDLAIFSPAVDGMSAREYLDICRAISKVSDYEVEVHLFGERHRRDARPSNFVGHILKTGKRVA